MHKPEPPAAPEMPVRLSRPDAPRTQAGRSARTRDNLLESAARGLSRYGYGNLVLEQVAREAGYTRGALYHQFKDKQDLTLAAMEWVLATWEQEVGAHVDHETDPVVALLTLARRHAIFCRREIARIAIALRVEFSGQDHPVGREVERAYDLLINSCTAFIAAGRENGTIPPGPPDRVLALAYVGAIEGAVVALAGQQPHDETLTVRAAEGILGINPVP